MSKNDFKGPFNAIIIFNLESITFSVKQRENTFADPKFILLSIVRNLGLFAYNDDTVEDQLCKQLTKVFDLPQKRRARLGPLPPKVNEPRHEKTGFLHMRKQKHRSASR